MASKVLMDLWDLLARMVRRESQVLWVPLVRKVPWAHLVQPVAPRVRSDQRAITDLPDLLANEAQWDYLDQGVSVAQKGLRDRRDLSDPKAIVASKVL